MKTDVITMKTLAAGPDGSLLPGQTYRVPEDVSRAQATELLDGGYATLNAEDTPLPPVPGTPAAADPAAADKPLDRMTVEQLKALADTEDIDLGPAAKKAELIEVITAERGKRAEAERAGGS